MQEDLLGATIDAVEREVAQRKSKTVNGGSFAIELSRLDAICVTFSGVFLK